MYKVIIAEDEPLALETLCTIVEKHCPEYEIIGRAEDGAAALEQIRTLRPDLVITDIQMPRFSGVQLAEIIRKEDPDTSFIIVSGYQDFEYMQSAVRSGVIDYLLKPIVPSQLKEALQTAAGRICQIHYQARNCLFWEIASGGTPDEQQLQRAFPAERYYAVLMRTKGLIRRFHMEKQMEIYSDPEEHFMVYGRDEMEELYLIPEDLVMKHEFSAYLERLQQKKLASSEPSDYLTTIYYEESFPIAQLGEQLQNLYRLLDMNSRIGESQCLNAKDLSTRKSVDKEERRLCERVWSVMELLASAGKTEQVKEEFLKGFDLWAKASTNQLWLESYVREVMFILNMHNLLALPMRECDETIGDLFYNATEMIHLAEDLAETLVGKKEESSYKVDSQENFERIAEYLEHHLREVISVQDLCRIFGISQTAMSKLFRTYGGESFNRYLTRLRMERAQELFRENPDSFIKDVAEQVGYEDQFYFSRIFRSYFGMSPTDYLKEAEAIRRS